MNIFPGPAKAIGVLVIALAAIWVSNNVSFVARFVGPRGNAGA